MDNYHECLVTRKNNSSDSLKCLGIGLLCALLSAAVIIFLPVWLFPFHLAFIGGICYGGYYFLSGINVEYEYIQTNDEIDFDKIIGRRKRKRLVTAPIKSFTAFGQISDAPQIGSDYTTVLASDNTGKNEWFCDFNHNSFGNVRVVFTPDERIIEAIEQYLPGPLKNEYKRRKMLNK